MNDEKWLLRRVFIENCLKTFHDKQVSDDTDAMTWGWRGQFEAEGQKMRKMRRTRNSPTISRNIPVQKKMVRQLQMRPWLTADVTERARRRKYEMCALLARARSSVDSVSLASRVKPAALRVPLDLRRGILGASNRDNTHRELPCWGEGKGRDLEPKTDLQISKLQQAKTNIEKVSRKYEWPWGQMGSRSRCVA